VECTFWVNIPNWTIHHNLLIFLFVPYCSVFEVHNLGLRPGSRKAGKGPWRRSEAETLRLCAAGSWASKATAAGYICRVYFSTLSEALPERYQFNGRSRNPAKDFFNCLLNYGYGVLYSPVEHGCILAGLDLYRPFAHGQIRRNICSASWASLTWRRFARTKGRSLP